MAVPSRGSLSLLLPSICLFENVVLSFRREHVSTSWSRESNRTTTLTRWQDDGMRVGTVPEREGGEPTGVEGFDEKLLLV